MSIEINNRVIGAGQPVYIIAEMSGNHGQDYDRACKIIHAAREAGADAIKLQTYTADTITINCDNDYFRIGQGTIWEGKTLYGLYEEAYTPWDWQPKLKAVSESLGLDIFSTPFDHSAVAFLEEMDVPAYKIASFELVDIPLIQEVAHTGKPIIISTGMSTLAEIDEALRAARDAGAREIALLQCTSSYPASPEEMNLRTIPHMVDAFGVSVGLSDHTLGVAVPVAAVALGACIVEKHLTLSRSVPGPDVAFSLEPDEFKTMVDAIRVTERAMGVADCGMTEKEAASRVFRRSLFVVKDMEIGETFSDDNVRSIRPGYGLHTRHLSDVTGRHALQDIARGTPLTWDLVGGNV